MSATVPAGAGWSAAIMAQLTGGEWLVAPGEDGWNTTGLCADVTQFWPGQMLLARAGAAGLGPAVVERLAPQSLGIIAECGSEYVRHKTPVLEVPDLREAVTSLAKAARQDFGGTVFAVTGSVGKTTTVAMAAHALAAIGECDRSRTSANSYYGIGWNLASMSRKARFWIQEMAIGRMDACSRLVRPDVAIVTAIGPAHLEDFGSTENIAKLKARIYQGMKPGGIAVINRDMPEFPIFEALALAAQLRVVSFGSGEDCDARFVGLDGKIVRTVIHGETQEFELGAPGHHMAMNAIAVLAAVGALRLDLTSAARQFGSFQPLKGRGKRSSATFEGKRLEVWDDSYNANPASMRAALRTMQASASIPEASRVLVLGDMLELGPDERDMHLSLEDDILAARPDRILFCGPLMQAVADRVLCDVKGRWFPDAGAMEHALRPWIHDGDVVLIKASHGTRLEKIVRKLSKDRDTGARPQIIRTPLAKPGLDRGRKESAPPTPRSFQRYSPPEIDAESAICLKVEKDKGQQHAILFDKQSAKCLPPASLTKLMTAAVMLDLMPRFGKSAADYLEIVEADVVGGSGINVKPGEKIAFRDAIANLLLPSSNITANAVARTFGQLLLGEEDDAERDPWARFVAEMNAKAVNLEMHHTQIKNPSGQPASGQLTTAADMARLMLTVIGYPEILKSWRKPTHIMRVLGPNPREQKIQSTVKVINDYDVMGGKTGTLLPRCYNVAVLSEAPNGERIVSVVLRARDQMALYSDLRCILDAVKRGSDWILKTPE
jgi:UDP-N-acetylmuramoyl-tripeptide--D-alanyl-D-alanine ligase